MEQNTDYSSRLALPLLIIASIVMAFAFQGTRGLWDPDEGRYTNVALEMMQTGDYFTPHRHHETKHVTKPPVTYWAIAASATVFGKNEWAFRLPMALAFVFTVCLVYQLGKSFTPVRPYLPALIYLCSPVTVLAANAITTDTLLACAETAGVVAYVNHRFLAKSRYWLDAMWALFGLAFMIKGPPGLLPLLAIIAWQARQARLRELVRPVGMVLFVAIGLTWFAWISYRYPELLNYFWGHEVVDRVASSTHDRNSQWYGGLIVYIPTLAIAVLPWAVLSFWHGRKASVLTPADGNSGFLWLWLAIPLAVFFIARSRLPFYILPLLVPVSLLLAKPLLEVPIRKRHLVFAGAWFIALLGIKGVVAYSPNAQDTRALSREISPLLPAKPRELVFVETKAAYGLHYYLDAEIEKISIEKLAGNQLPSDAEYDQDLHSELFEAEADRYFLVPHRSSSDFVKAVSASDMNARLLGKTKKLAIYDITANRK